MDRSQIAAPLELFGRQNQFQQITQALAHNKDLLIVGVPGSGRRTLVRRAALEVGAKIVEVDCIRATDGWRLAQLICEGITQAVKTQGAIAFLREWVMREAEQFFEFQDQSQISLNLKLSHSASQEELLPVYDKLLKLPQQLANAVGREVVIIFQGFPHIRSWDRHRQWEQYLRSEIKRQKGVSYVLVATLAESSDRVDDRDICLEIIKLTPLADDVVAAWAQTVLHQEGLTFDPRSQALYLFLSAVQGHIGNAFTVIRRLCNLHNPNHLIGDREIKQTIQEVLADFSSTFESLLSLLPPSQVHLLESLALDPTDKPQSRNYINKHHLCRGGSLQGALLGLQRKGLIYSADLGYRLAIPLFALWIRQRLS
jgi:hypothetical protein